METALTVLSSLLAIAEDTTSSSSVLVTVVTGLENLLPLAVQEYNTLKQPVMNIIAAIEGNSAANEAALVALAPVSAQFDAAWAAATPGGAPATTGATA